MTPRRLGTFGRGLVKTYCPGMARAVRDGVVDLAADGGEALRRYLELDPPPVPAAVLLDNRMPVLTGLEAAERILDHNPQQVVVLFSAHLDEQVERHAAELGVAACVSKMSASELPSILRGLLEG